MFAATARRLSSPASCSSPTGAAGARVPAPAPPRRDSAATRAPRGGDLPCRLADGDAWFSDDPATVELAKASCLPCPLRQACLAGALERGEPWGVWGGQLFVQGEVVARKRPRGRPRKNAVAA